MFSKPGEEHQWLSQLLGEWTFRHDCETSEGQKSETTGVMTCRSLDGMWLLCESAGESPDGPWTSIMTLGFDPTKGCYVGTFVGSMMSNLWLYDGKVDEDGKRLILNTQGPSFDGTTLCDYVDTIEIVDATTWWLRSAMKNEQGELVTFMNGEHTRR